MSRPTPDSAVLINRSFAPQTPQRRPKGRCRLDRRQNVGAQLPTNVQPLPSAEPDCNFWHVQNNWGRQRPIRVSPERAHVGHIHRMAARLDGEIELTAGAFSLHPEKGMRSQGWQSAKWQTGQVILSEIELDCYGASRMQTVYSACKRCSIVQLWSHNETITSALRAVCNFSTSLPKAVAHSHREPRFR